MSAERPAWTTAYLAALQLTQSPGQAALLAGVSRNYATRYIAENPDFSLEVDEVRRLAESDFWIAPFLERLAATGLVAQSAREAGVSWHTVLKRRRRDPEFDELYEEAKALAADGLEGVARRRATVGEDEPVVFQGVLAQRRVIRVDADGIPLPDPSDPNRPWLVPEFDAKGQPVPLTIKVADNKLLARLLEGHKPELYHRPQKHEVTGAEGGPVQAQVMIVTGVPQPAAAAGFEDIA